MGNETRGALFAAMAATIGNLLQGWDNATIAGAVIYIKKEFKLESEPTIEGLILAMSLIGATLITTFSGPVSDKLGRRPMLIMSSIFYLIGGLVMFWSPNIYVLLLGRLLDGLGVGLAVTLVPLYVSETSPPEIRGQLNTLPQFTGSFGMLFSYCMIFSMSLKDSPSWRLMLGLVSLPSLFYLAFTVFYLPESPRWLVSIGNMSQAEIVLRKLRRKQDVKGEMALLVEGLGSGGETSIEEYVIGEENDEYSSTVDKNHVKLYGSQQGQSWIARAVRGQSALGMASRCGSMTTNKTKMVDPLVTMFGSVHENVNPTGSMLFPNFGSMFNANDLNQGTTDEWDEEKVHSNNTQDSGSEEDSHEYDETDMKSPLLSRYTSNHQNPHNSTGIGGGWQLAWKYNENKGKDGKKEGSYKRIYLKQDGGMASTRGSMLSLAGGGCDIPQGSHMMMPSAALVSQSAIRVKDPKNEPPVCVGSLEPSEDATKGASWNELFEPGVKHALIVGVGIQILQQFSGINGVLYYTPQILEQAGVGVLMSSLGLSDSSSSILISALTTLLMLPSIGLAMRLMDISGRRFLLLNTIPILIVALILLVIANLVDMGQIPRAMVSTISVVLYFCCFVMGFGPIPNILCSEIFPTRVRGLCIAICSLTFWAGDITVTYSLPAMLSAIGLGGVFGIYACVCVASWIFVYLKVPETKGMPLEVITDFFNVGARKTVDDAAPYH